MEKFKYDHATLIKLVELKPCLWDKSCKSYKIRRSKQLAWEEVYSNLNPGYSKMKKKDRQNMSKLIQGKWQNLRDYFVKFLKKTGQEGSTKKYIYADNFQFLVRVLKEDCDSRFWESETETKKVKLEESSTEDEEYDIRETPINQEIAIDPPDDVGSQRPECRQEELVKKMLVSFQNPKLDADEAFFISLIPSVKKMTEDEKLEFKIGVLGLIKDIKTRATTQISSNSLHDCAPSNSRTACQYSSQRW